MSKEAMKLALDRSEPSILSPGWTLVRDEDIAALREALAEQPAQQEPVAYRVKWPAIGGGYKWLMVDKPLMEKEGFVNEALYTSPPAQRKPLTDEQFKKIKASLSHQEGWDGDGWDLALKEAIEAAHGIKENT